MTRYHRRTKTKASVPYKFFSYSGLSFLLGPALFFFILQPLSSSSLSNPFFRGHQNPREFHSFGINLAVSSLLRIRPFKSWFKANEATLGHTDPALSLGLKESEKEEEKNETDDKIATERPNSLEDDDLEDESVHRIGIEEMKAALSSAQRIASSTHDEIVQEGWKLVHQEKEFSLYKRRQKHGQAEGPVEYLMCGQFDDISPRTFLIAQIERSIRKLWDKTMKDMSEGTISLISGVAAGVDKEVNKQELDSQISGDLAPSPINTDEITPEVTENINELNEVKYEEKYKYTARMDVTNDLLYFRTKWPWPMKDRDYVLARRCKIFHDESAIVLVSKSTEVYFPMYIYIYIFPVCL
jgi:hypothetical protein